MPKSIVSLTRLQNPDDVMYWARQLVDELQRIFLGSGAGFIDGDSILDGTLGTDKLLATAGGLWHPTPVSYPSGTTSVIQLSNTWANSGGVVYGGANELQSPNFYGWGIITFSGHFDSPNAVNTHVQLEENDGQGYYTRAAWTGGIPLDPNIALLAPIPASSVFRMTIRIDASEPAKILGAAPLFTLGMIGQVEEPA